MTDRTSSDSGLLDRAEHYLNCNAAESGADILIAELCDALRKSGHAPRSTVDPYSFNAGIEAAAGLCEVTVKPLDGGEVEPAAPLHARWIRQAKLGTVSDTSADREGTLAVADALSLLSDLFSETVHETWNKEEIVEVIEDFVKIRCPQP